MYIEYYIIENLLINYIIISCTSILTKIHNSNKRKWLGASVGALYSVAYIYPSFDMLFSLPFKVLTIIFITLISFTYKDKKEYIKILITFYLVNIFISGSTAFIIYFTGIEHIKISFLIVCVYVSGELLKYIYNDIKTLKHMKEVSKEIEINFLSKNCTCEALIDSGNLLKDPIGNNDVIIVKSKALTDILPELLINYDYEDMDMIKIEEIINNVDTEISSRIRMIPYSHAGSKKSNMILGLKADYIEIDKHKIGNIILGISEFNDSKYSAIISPTILP